MTNPDTIFHTAKAITSLTARAAYLDAACPPALRSQIEAMLKADDLVGNFLATSPDNRAAPNAPTAHDSNKLDSAARIGSRIGHYKLLQEIGHGGFGTVYLAEQFEPVRRKVAVKIINPGMDSKQVIGRFEAERQALAMMDHPHIARVLDGGLTSDLRPYFVMEYVVGDAITKFADAHSLTLKERLDLFQQVCSAIQHAHTKGIIHRDLKPGNVLVSMVDGKPFAKVIDFGIAKATGAAGGRLSNVTFFTEHQQVIGTPEYMSPEQAEGSLDIDTRTDVYSLGVLLYELLTGSTPIESSRLRSAAFDEMRRIIREEEPPAPSLKLSRSLEKLASTAAVRKTEPGKLSALVRGELDWIVLKALEKERGRRYETASSFADDVRRHLSGEPVVAAPISKMYRLRKFVRKNRGPVVAVGAVMLALVAGGTVAAWQSRRANSLQHTTESQRDMLNSALRDVAAQVASSQGFDRLDQSVTTTDDQGQRRASILRLRRTADGSMQAQIEGRRGVTSDTGTFVDRGPAPASFESSVELLQGFITDAFETRTSALQAAEWSAYTANLALAQAAMEAGNYPEARLRLADAPESKREWEWQLTQARADSVVWSTWGWWGPVAFSSDGLHVFRMNEFESTPEGFVLNSWEVASGRSVAFEKTQSVREVSISLTPTGDIVTASAPWTRPFRQISFAESWIGNRLVGKSKSGFAISQDKLHIAWTGTPDGEHTVNGFPIEGSSNRLKVARMDAWGGPVKELGSWNAFESLRQRLLIDLILASSPNGPSGLTITIPDGTRRIVGGSDKTVRFYETKGGKPTLPATAEQPDGVYREVAVFRMSDAVTNLQMTGDGTRLIIHLADGSARVWDIRDPQERRKDLQAEWAQRVPTGAYLDTLWASDTPDEKLRDVIINDASLTPLARLVAAEMLEERLEDDRKAAEAAKEKITKDATPTTDPVAIRAAAEAAELPPRVKARLVGLVKEWQPPTGMSEAEKRLAEEKRRADLAEASRISNLAEEEVHLPSDAISRALAIQIKELGPSHPETVRTLYRFPAFAYRFGFTFDKENLIAARAVAQAVWNSTESTAEQRAWAASGLAAIAVDAGEFAEAAKWFTKFDAVRRQIGDGPKIPGWFSVYHNVPNGDWRGETSVEIVQARALGLYRDKLKSFGTNEWKAREETIQHATRLIEWLDAMPSYSEPLGIEIARVRNLIREANPTP